MNTAAATRLASWRRCGGMPSLAPRCCVPLAPLPASPPPRPPAPPAPGGDGSWWRRYPGGTPCRPPPSHAAAASVQRTKLYAASATACPSAASSASTAATTRCSTRPTSAAPLPRRGGGGARLARGRSTQLSMSSNTLNTWQASPPPAPRSTPSRSAASTWRSRGGERWEERWGGGTGGRCDSCLFTRPSELRPTSPHLADRRQRPKGRRPRLC